MCQSSRISWERQEEGEIEEEEEGECGGEVEEGWKESWEIVKIQKKGWLETRRGGSDGELSSCSERFVGGVWLRDKEILEVWK